MRQSQSGDADGPPGALHRDPSGFTWRFPGAGLAGREGTCRGAPPWDDPVGQQRDGGSAPPQDERDPRAPRPHPPRPHLPAPPGPALRGGAAAPCGGRPPPMGAGRARRPRPPARASANETARSAPAPGARRPRLAAVQRRRRWRPLPPRARRPVAPATPRPARRHRDVTARLAQVTRSE